MNYWRNCPIHAQCFLLPGYCVAAVFRKVRDKLTNLFNIDIFIYFILNQYYILSLKVWSPSYSGWSRNNWTGNSWTGWWCWCDHRSCWWCRIDSRNGSGNKKFISTLPNHCELDFLFTYIPFLRASTYVTARSRAIQPKLMVFNFRELNPKCAQVLKQP